VGLISAITREYIYVSSIARTLWLLRPVKPHATRSIVDIVEGQARRRPDNVAIYHLDQQMTYAQLDARANRYAHWAMAQGLGRGDVVAILMENRPDYLCAWLGLFKVGAQAALINTNLIGTALAHSITISAAKAAIVGAELAQNFRDAPFEIRPPAWIEGEGGNLTAALDAASDAAPGKAARAGVTLKDRAFLIYTSGTTGLPKAANFSHMRMLFMMTGFVGALRPRDTDRIYDPLPLYHSTGGVCAVGLAFLSGGALILKRKFSCMNSGATSIATRPPCSNISANCAATCSTRRRRRWSAATRCAPSPATAFGPRSGANSRRVSPLRASWNSTAPPKAMSPC
jgi:fatty-acyl-CoA synthase